MGSWCTLIVAPWFELHRAQYIDFRVTASTMSGLVGIELVRAFSKARGWCVLSPHHLPLLPMLSTEDFLGFVPLFISGAQCPDWGDLRHARA